MIRKNEDAVGRAAGWLLFGVTGGLGLDLCAKQLLGTYPLAQFVFLRSLVGIALFLLLAGALGGRRALATRRWRWHVLRTVLASGSMFGFFFGLSRMPLVNALTLAFTAPLMLTALSGPLLGERVGWRRWLAVLVGFAGVLVVLRPSAGILSPAALAVLAAAFCYACLAISARHLGYGESSYALAVYVVAGPLAISGLLVFAGDAWVSPDRTAWILFALAGACSVVAWLGIVNGYRRAAPSVLAPLEYLALVGGAIAGYVFWGEVPDGRVIAGAGVIIASGLYVVLGEVNRAAQDAGQAGDATSEGV
jgi:drug/metabolite transporter (DMT)-like permease